MAIKLLYQFGVEIQRIILFFKTYILNNTKTATIKRMNIAKELPRYRLRTKNIKKQE